MLEMRFRANRERVSGGDCVVESAMRTVVIGLLDPVRDAVPGLLEALVFVESHLLFFQAAMEQFDITVALEMVAGGDA